jgi:hypothetical protein
VADDSPGTRAYRRGFRQKNKRDDYALDLFEEAGAKLTTDPPRVAAILGELARLYNALVDGPIVDLECRGQILSLLAGGRAAEAERLLHRRYELYAPLDDGDREGPASAGG